MLSLGSVVTIILWLRSPGVAQCCCASQSICLDVPPCCGKSQRQERAAVQGLDSVPRSPESAPASSPMSMACQRSHFTLGDAGSGLKSPSVVQLRVNAGSLSGLGKLLRPLTPGLKTLNPKVWFLEPLVTEETTASQSC